MESISDLNNCKEEIKIEDCLIRVTYQIKESEENEYVARSLEESIINKNLDFFKNTFKIINSDEETTVTVKSKFELLKNEDLSDPDIYELSPNSNEKSQFTFDLMTFDEETTKLKWEVPLYIKEGLEWLAKNDNI